jgi:polar amino acid transport system substrate-binding protein
MTLLFMLLSRWLKTTWILLMLKQLSFMRLNKPIFASILCFLILIPTVSLYAQNSSKEALRWGADAEGGAPYEFQDPADPSRIIGFEVDIVNALGRILGRQTVFVQNQWDGLIPGLERGNYELVVSGLEITADRSQVINFSLPYYVTYEQLVVRNDENGIRTLDDCRGKKIGTLKASLAERMLQERSDIEVLSYDGQINAYQDLLNRRLDAVLMDYIIGVYNVAILPGLKMTGEPIGRIEYGIGVRKQDPVLLQQINAALQQIIESGELKRILEDWNLWTPQCAGILGNDNSVSRHAAAYEAFVRSQLQKTTGWKKVRQYISYLPLLAKGALVTLELSVIAMFLAVIAGLNIALLRLYGPRFLSALSVVYIELIRGTPLLVQLFLIFYGLPHIGIKFSPMLAAILGLALNYSAYEAENYRAGIQSIPRTQTEAALALGMTHLQALRHVIIPQAVRMVIPPVTNDFVALLKDSSLVSVITMVELTKAYSQLASIHYDYLGIGLLAAAMYFLVGLPFVRLARLAERYFTPGRKLFVAGGKQKQAPV